MSQSISPIKDKDGQIIGASTIARDITAEVAARKESEEKLAAASQYARSLIEVVPGPAGHDQRRRQDHRRQRGHDQGHRRSARATDRHGLLQLLHRAGEGPRRATSRSSPRASSPTIPLTIRHQDGRLTDVLYNASVYKDTSGNVLGVFAAARDVTVQKQASQYARSLIESSLDPLVTISADGKITDVNEATIKVTGVPREQLIGTDFSNYFTEPEKAREGYQQVFAKGFVTDYPLTIRHKDGRLTDVLYNASVYKDTARQRARRVRRRPRRDGPQKDRGGTGRAAPQRTGSAGRAGEIPEADRRTRAQDGGIEEGDRGAQARAMRISRDRLGQGRDHGGREHRPCAESARLCANVWRRSRRRSARP